MKIRGMEVNSRMVIWIALYGLTIIDIILITIAMIFPLPEGVVSGIMSFDFCICILLLAEWFINLHLASPKSEFLKQKSNWILLIASIPFDVILPVVIPGIGVLRYLRLLKILRFVVLFNRFFDGFERFMEKSNLDKVIAAMFFIIVVFTTLLYFFGSTYNLFDDFYFVIVTLTTVGYGDIVPKTYTEKIISLILIIIGIFVFSTITASISSFFTDRILEDDDDSIVESIDGTIEEKFEILDGRLKSIQEENAMLKDEIKQLKDLIKNN